MLCKAVILVAVLCMLSPARAELGFDLSYFQGAVDASAFSCLRDSGYGFGIIEATEGSTANLNPYIATVFANAKQYIPNVDVYIFPDTSYGASSLMSSYISSLISDGVLTTNMVWMDIEGPQYWSSDCSSNQSWLADAINQIDSMYKGCGLSSCVGIYASESQWSPIMCNTSQFSNHQLWWAYYDDDASFDDFSAFGGWSKPNMKQYKGTTYICGTAIDEDYY